MQIRRFLLDKNWIYAFEGLGFNKVEVIQAAGLPIDILNRETITLDVDEYYNLWNALANSIEDKKKAVKFLFEEINFEHISPPIMAAICSPDFETCVYRIRDFKPLIGPLILDVSANEFDFSIGFRCIEPKMKLHPFLVAFEFMFFVRIIRHGTGLPLVPKRIETKSLLPDLDFKNLLGVSPQQGSKDQVTFSIQDARKPFQTKNETIWSFFEPELRKRLHELEIDTNFSAKVRSVLVELLPLGKSEIEAVADKLIVSKRTLQRRLQSENTNYQKQLNHSRELLARNYLLNSDMTSTEIAFLIGYDDPSSFSRAFHLWTGMTPEALRLSYSS